jgi:hypothetical protein
MDSETREGIENLETTVEAADIKSVSESEKNLSI